MCQDVHNRVNFCRIVKEPRHKGSFFHQNTNLRNEVDSEKKRRCVCVLEPEKKEVSVFVCWRVDEGYISAR